ncbi:hypothetical protein [Halobellus rubicundus]|uniref:DUF1963 domain-containing protein n=1 Tax=Halobellus rubicundus TaxID=2996466 RepID=A0ABD5MHX9_9EURY
MSTATLPPRTLDVVDAPDGRDCQLWSVGEDDDEATPSPCDNDADYLFVYEASTDPSEDGRRNALACSDCFTPPGDPVAEEVPV